MSTAPRVDIDVEAFWDDPYPVLATLRAQAHSWSVKRLAGRRPARYGLRGHAVNTSL